MNNTFFFHNVKKMFCHDRIHTNSVSAMQLMEIHVGLLPYPKENDTSEEVSLYLLSF
jgi:hypothetical protein